VLYVVVGVVLGLVMALALLVFAVTAPSERLQIPRDVPAPADPTFLELVSLASDVQVSDGNEVEILLDGGPTFKRLFADLCAARRSITVQLYYCAPGTIADQLAAVLVDRAHAGVRVLFLHDAFGSELPDSYIERLRDAGVDARTFRPMHWWTLHKAQERSHARIVVVDGRVGYTGGFGIDDRWSAEGAGGQPGWRDTNVRFTGPAVASLQAAFAAGWAETAGQLLVDEIFYPDLGNGPSSHPGDVTAGLLHSRPDVGTSTAERLLVLTLAAARRTLYIANAYFVPSTQYRRLLLAAVERGVDVRILTASETTDIPIARYAGRGFYTELLRGGVRIYEYLPTMMHAKTLVADRLWASIGTLNFDNRSLALNEESTLLASDPDVGARMEEIFLDDLEHAAEITLEAFARRGPLERTRERLAAAGARLL
jgi:cardiolipin synthase A/B